MVYKSSKQRDEIYNYLSMCKMHLKAEEIFSILKDKGSNISLATIYRNLGILEDQCLIKKIPVQDGYVYDGDIRDHHHFYCKHCKTLYDVNVKYDNNINDMLCNDIGFVDSHSILFEGKCKKCLTNGGN